MLLQQAEEGGEATAAAGHSAAAPALPAATYLSAEEVASGRQWSAKVLLMAGMDTRCARTHYGHCTRVFCLVGAEHSTDHGAC